MKIKSIKCLSGAFFAVGMILQLCPYAIAESGNWETAVSMMKKGADQMVEGRTIMQQKKDLGSAEKMIKDGHRTMMEAEKTAARIQKDTMKQGAKMMMDGLQVPKAKKDTGEAEKLMQLGQKMILEAERMMTDPRPEKFMTGSRTMMRGLRMLQKTDVNTADKLMTDGQSLMVEAAKTMRDKQ